ncbi:hypothetical protein GCM10011376_33540 [Nocardioides flavus (ex Wang et al. 2016)]|uniref:Lipoprotein n=1 Tax=Nocardioides flavus (ex Wang et al. 2016) TaxID=2058780 RepID=A0ABQ3HQ32_9ACTN|nr:hypothetical protein [Nocardioides flavus (ex Wang et al. 2016)]GHE18744.1 hypothetical protein GCM10011376_33540 [Nocardioides flavus (ex Wang et al. 2016)]
MLTSSIARGLSLTTRLTGLVLLGALSACASGGDDSATDPAGTTGETTGETPGETPTESSSPTEGAPEALRAVGSAGVTEVLLLQATEGGGSPSTLAFALDTEQAVDDFVVDLRAGLPAQVSAAVADLRSPGATPYGSVVSTGCEPPRSVAVDAGEAGFEVVPALPRNTVECLAPVTYVVVFDVPDA